MSKAAIIDTNVVVSGLLTADASTATARILDGMLAAEFPFVVSTALLAEYCEVLNRDKLRRQHGLDAPEVETVVTQLAQNATLLQPVSAPAAPDAGDQHLWELLAAGDALMLVTGDKRLHQADWAERIWTPHAWLRQAGHEVSLPAGGPA